MPPIAAKGCRAYARLHVFSEGECPNGQRSPPEADEVNLSQINFNNSKIKSKKRLAKTGSAPGFWLRWKDMQSGVEKSLFFKPRHP